MFDETRASLKKLGLPGGDLYQLPTSGKTFPDGAHFRMEVPTINSFEAFKALIDRATELGVTINRIDETYGIFRHTLGELRDYCALGKERGVAINLSVGPRAPYDTGATVQTPQGVRIAYRLRGMEQVVRAIEDVKRAVSVGCRGILVYDEGLLWVLVEMKKTGELPADLQFKVSAHCGHANPAAFKVLAGLGAHTINPVRDLQLPMLAALRGAVLERGIAFQGRDGGEDDGDVEPQGLAHRGGGRERAVQAGTTKHIRQAVADQRFTEHPTG